MKRIRKVKVTKIFQLSENMKRITFSSIDLNDFPEDQNGGYVKFLFKKKSSDKLDSLARPYTIRDFRRPSLELDVDFSYHSGNQGYATKWAYEARIGDEISISGPGSKQSIDYHAKWFFFVGDMTSLPAISSYLEKLPSKARGYAVIEIKSINDKVLLKKPQHLEIKWIVKSQVDQNPQELIDVVKKINWRDSIPYVWVACEFSKMKHLRDFFQKEKRISKNQMYISSYWKLGLDQEKHKIAKKEDSLKWEGEKT